MKVVDQSVTQPGNYIQANDVNITPFRPNADFVDIGGNPRY